MKLSVRVPPLLRIRNARFPEPDLAIAAIALEKAGISLIELDAVSEPSNELWRELQRMREAVDIPLGIRILPLHSAKEAIPRYLELHPERITLSDISTSDVSQPLSLSDEKYDFSEVVRLVREHGAESIVKIAPDLNELKRAAKMRCFGVEFDTREWRTLRGTERRVAQEKWRDAALAAWKLGLTIECETTLHADTLAVLRAIPELGGLVLGEEFWAKSILYGIDQTVLGIRNAM